MEEIIEAITNGNRKHALELLQQSHHDFIDLIVELQSTDNNREIIRMMHVAYGIGYLTENTLDYEKFR